MYMTAYTMSEARAALATLLDAVERGEDVLITRHGRPAARLVPPRASSPRTADVLWAAERLAVELETARERPGPLPAPDSGPDVDEVVARLRAERDAWAGA